MRQPNTTRRHPAFALVRLSMAAVLTFALMAGIGLAGCSSDGEKKAPIGEALSAKLRRVEVASATFSEMSLRVIVALNNPTQKDIQLRKGEVSLSVAGKAKAIAALDDEEEEDTAEDEDAATATEDATDGEGEEEEESEEGEEDEGDAEEEADDDSDVDAAASEGIIDGVWHKGSVEDVTIPAYAQSEVAIELTLPLPNDPSALERMLQWQRMVVQIKGVIEAGGAQETFAGRREVGVPVFPQVLLQGAQISSTDGGTDGEAYLTLEVDNPNPFPIVVDKFAWGATVGGKEMRKMSKPSKEEVPPSSRLQSEDTIRLDEETYGKEVKKLLNQPTVPYVISGFYEVRGIRREFKFEGDMAFAR